MAKVFWLERSDRVELSLRRYHSSSDANKCPGPMSYHNARVFWRDIPAKYVDSHGRESLDVPPEGPSHDDPLWPLKCEGCEYLFTPEDHWQVFSELIYRRGDTGEETTLRDAPVGAMWDAYWMTEWFRGPDGICLMVKTPAGEWMVDGEASNCTDPAKNHPRQEGDHTIHERTHLCWIRHGDPRTGQVHVDKDGKTCAAGAGSILQGSYHGFLHNGELTAC